MFYLLKGHYNPEILNPKPCLHAGPSKLWLTQVWPPDGQDYTIGFTVQGLEFRLLIYHLGSPFRNIFGGALIILGFRV